MALTSKQILHIEELLKDAVLYATGLQSHLDAGDYQAVYDNTNYVRRKLFEVRNFMMLEKRIESRITDGG